MTIWIDVEDLFDYAAVNPRPSGIQRVEYELCRAMLSAVGEGPVRFLRHRPDGGFRAVPWAEVEALFGAFGKPRAEDEAGQPAAGTLTPGTPDQPRLARRALRWVSHRVPAHLRAPLREALSLQLRAVRMLAGTGRLALAGPAARASGHARPPGPSSGPDAFDAAAPGDLLLVLGSPWFAPDYGARIAALKAEKGLRFGVLLYDIIPLRRPEFCDAGLVRIFTHWLGTVLPHADLLMAISRASAEDTRAYAEEKGWGLRTRPVPIPMGTGFGTPAPAARLPGRAYPEAGSYALIVSTIEARKNHLLLFRVWRRLLEDLPRDQVPTLVFAGRVGWMVSDLMQQLRNADFLDGKLVLFQDPTDGELTTLYQGARFTLFPSFYEGWGLPVTESLAFGKPPIISNTTSLPEAGGALARYFDPENTTEAYRVIREVVEDPEGLRNWQARVARDFRPVSWDETAAAVLRLAGEAAG